MLSVRKLPDLSRDLIKFVEILNFESEWKGHVIDLREITTKNLIRIFRIRHLYILYFTL